MALDALRLAIDGRIRDILDPIEIFTRDREIHAIEVHGWFSLQTRWFAP
jgi:hypothetical protein